MAVPNAKSILSWVGLQLRQQRVFGGAILAIIGLYCFLYAALDQGLLSRSAWDSYTLQAIAWWQGRVTLSENYSYLELALYRDRVFVSFPPFPSVVWFLLVPIVGAATPNNLVCSLYAIASFGFAFSYAKFKTLGDHRALFWSLFLVFGSNILYMSTNGGVWFQAQVLSFLLTIAALYCIEKATPFWWHLCFALLACAVGCRPFQILFFVYLGARLWQQINVKSSRHKLAACLPYLISPVLIGSSYALYNFVRFGSITEFGRRYLPEFTSVSQFSTSNIWPNLLGILRWPHLREGQLILPQFEGFAFYLANPLFIAFALRLLYRYSRFGLRKDIRLNLNDILIPVLIGLHMLLTLCHKGMGGWQFGSRYLVDGLPLLFTYVISLGGWFSRYEIALLIGAIAFNVYGTLWLFLDWA